MNLFCGGLLIIAVLCIAAVGMINLITSVLRIESGGHLRGWLFAIGTLLAGISTIFYEDIWPFELGCLLVGTLCIWILLPTKRKKAKNPSALSKK